MKVTSTGFTVAEYCGQMNAGSIVVNREYQRSNRVWPPAARSYLIDTILLGFPMPKLSLYQKTDLKTRQTIKEIVDGQQRSQAISDFFNDRLRLSGPTSFRGKLYSQLEEDEQQRFLNYEVIADVFAAATQQQIRESFRRINSYNVPLNPAEVRHATFQGEFKWFVYSVTQAYSQALKDTKILTENQLVRMADAALIADILYAREHGHVSASDKQLRDIYEKYEDSFPDQERIRHELDQVFSIYLELWPFLSPSMLKPYIFFSLFVAIWHRQFGVPILREARAGHVRGIQDLQRAALGLSNLGSALEDNKSRGEFGEFVEACAGATNRVKQRKIRFEYLFRALG